MTAKIILRDERTQTDSRYLSVSLNPDGALLFEGQDLGDEVERFFDAREYEWVWTIRPEHLPALRAALGNPEDVLACVGMKFGGENAAYIGTFLDEHKIEYEKWSRVGD